MYRSKSLENKELMALCSRGRYLYDVQDMDCNSEDEESDSEFYKGEMRNSLSMDNCVYQVEEEEEEEKEEEGQVYFSNQEYYWRLEELKKTHLRNMAELEKMYIGRSEGGQQNYQHGLGLGGGGNSLTEEQAAPTRRLQRINSQEELDFHDTSSGSDQSELSNVQDSVGELEMFMDCLAGIPSQDTTFGRDRLVNPEAGRLQFFLQASRNNADRLKPKPALSQSAMSRSGMSRSGMVAWAKPTSKPTVPKPFRMMLREEERKRRQVRTRSEVELENTLLRRELEELRECRKKFRASPAPAHTHLSLYEVIGRGATQRSRAETSCDRANPATGLMQPFSFLERERRKKEARIVAELGNLCPKEVSCTFKARPLPCSVYGSSRQRGVHSPEAKTKSPSKSPFATSKSQADKGSLDEIQHEAVRGRLPERSWISGRCSVNKSVKKHMEVSIEMVKEREWSHVHPHLGASCDVHTTLGPDEEMHILADKSVY
ncbi:protein FAM161A-like [Gadus macrocephalus]|uniref:protein FAM161A-like n=1 Tax=Gadus macrocephalus TaxID=80720 RepID=UPI0028CB7911|nr:protein FAM161A-like [Gadus macrocephalus]